MSLAMKRSFAGLFVVGLLMMVHIALLEGLDGLWYQFLSERPSTVFAAGYTDGLFRSIATGMNSDDVRKILGAPLLVYPPENGCEQWWYSKKANTRSYHMRTITICGGRVAKKNAEFYLG